MTLQDLSIPSTAEGRPLPLPLLENLASRFRVGGLCLLAFAEDGRLSWIDPAAGAFFHRYAAPLVRADPLLAERLRCLPTDAPGVIIESVPGVLLAVVPYVERRQIGGTIALAARSEWAGDDEDVLRTCGRLSLDTQWTSIQAHALPGYGREQLQRQGELLSAMLQDQVRLGAADQELQALSQQLTNAYEELTLIYQLSSGMRVNRRAADFFKQACLDVLNVIDVRGMGVTLYGEAWKRSEPVLYGEMTLPLDALRRLSTQLLPVLSQRKAPLLINQLGADQEFGWLADYARQLLVVPLLRDEQVNGCLFAFDKEQGEFDSVDSKLLNSIANESAIYLENSMLFGDVHGLMMGLLHSLTSAVDAKDAYTCGHSERVALMSHHLAREIALPDREVDQIYMAGLLHDVGKIGVPETVLQKTGRLTPEEFELMKKHPEIGARILADVKQIKPIVPGVLYHHERYDGKGYPSGLAGNDIPLMGRIICLADCFDAMTSNRTYRKALPLEVALTEIRRCAGTQFDPTLAEAFLRTGPEGFRELLHNHAEKSKKLLELQQTLRTA